MKKRTIIHGFAMGMLFVFTIGCRETGTVTDADGNVYKTVKIGNQWWMAENLKTTKYHDGTPIPLVTDSIVWSSLTSPGYCWYNNDSGAYKNTYGALYNWYAVSTGKLAPSGWHVPTDAEWKILTDFLGGEKVAGGKMKEKGKAHWTPPNKGATNRSGFTALPGGVRSHKGGFSLITNAAHFWSSFSDVPTSAWGRILFYFNDDVFRTHNARTYGFSVRFVKD